MHDPIMFRSSIPSDIIPCNHPYSMHTSFRYCICLVRLNHWLCPHCSVQPVRTPNGSFNLRYSLTARWRSNEMRHWDQVRDHTGLLGVALTHATPLPFIIGTMTSARPSLRQNPCPPVQDAQHSVQGLGTTPGVPHRTGLATDLESLCNTRRPHVGIAEYIRARRACDLVDATGFIVPSEYVSST